MKAVIFVLIVMFALGVIVSFSGISFAESKNSEYKENCEATIKVLQDSAAALQQSNPDLAKGLTDYADEKAKKMQEWKECKARYEARTKLLTDSAAALEKTNPGMAKSLKEMSECKYDKKMHEMQEEKNEKE